MNVTQRMGSLAAVMLAVAIAACLAVLPGCSKSAEDTIRESLTRQLDVFKADDKKDLLKDLVKPAKSALDQLGVDADEFGVAYLKGFDYELGGITVDEDAGTAKLVVTVSIKSMNDILNSFTTSYQEWATAQDSAPSNDELMKKGGELLMDEVEAAKPKKVDVTLAYKKGDDGTWVASDGLADEVAKVLVG